MGDNKEAKGREMIRKEMPANDPSNEGMALPTSPRLQLSAVDGKEIRIMTAEAMCERLVAGRGS